MASVAAICPDTNIELSVDAPQTSSRADRQRLSARLELLQAQASQNADAAALFQALGGNWIDGPAKGSAARS